MTLHPTPTRVARSFVALDPMMRSGAATLNHTRLPVATVAGFVWARDPIALVMDAYNITRADVLVCCWYAGMYGTRAERKRFGEWAKAAHGLMWSDRLDEVSDPPSSARIAEVTHA